MEGEHISANESYTKTEFLRRIGRKEAAWRSLRRAGLRTIELCGGKFVLGSDWIEHLKSQADSTEANA